MSDTAIVTINALFEYENRFITANLLLLDIFENYKKSCWSNRWSVPFLEKLKLKTDLQVIYH